MGSLRCPFTVEIATEKSVLLRSMKNNRRQKKFDFTTFSPAILCDVEVRCLKTDSFPVHSSNGKKAANGCCRGKLLRTSPRATGKNAIKGDDADNEEDDILKISKSKNVVSQQKDLLREIEEKRKLVSSIKNSKVYRNQDDFSYRESDNAFSNLDLPFSEELDEKYRNGILPDSYAESSLGETLGTTSVVGGDFDDEEQKSGSSTHSARVSSAIDAPQELKETAQSAINLSPLPKTSETQVEEDVNGELNTTPKAENAVTPPLAGTNVMNIIVVAAECAPWSKTGGLGDVAGTLPKALARRGHRVMVVAPCYGNYHEAQETGVRKRYKVDGQDVEVTYFQAYIDGVDFVFMECHMFRYRQNDIYGGESLDILKRMILFCKAAVEIPWNVPCGGVCYGDGNLVFIANDWHTALLPVYLKAYYRDNGIMLYTRSVLVIHNIAHQGRGPLDHFAYVDLPDHYKDLFTLYDPLGGEHFNIFAAGLKTADRIVTVSHGYAWEIKTLEGGWGLHNIINENDWKLRGIVNGIDAKEWNPKFDVHLTSDGYSNYSIETFQDGKPQCKEALQRELGLPVRDNVPLIGFIGRLDYQKGVDLIAEAIPWLVGQDVQLIMLGTGNPDLEDMLRQFESQHHDKVRGWVGFSVKLAHRITAGADILLMPSRFEPCGLNQLYAMMYGTIPVVHAVGGLRDTVLQFDPFNESGLGWTFERAEMNRLTDALGNCLLTYREYKSSWEGLQRRAMMQDLSWDNAAQQYEEVLVAAKYQW